MSPDEFFKLLADLGLTVTGAAHLLDVPRQDVVAWISGERPIPHPVTRFLVFMRSANVTPEEVMKALSGASEA